MKKHLRLNIIILLLAILSKSFGQDRFRFQTVTDSVVQDGFYQINLLPAIMAKCKPTLHDLRLLDASGSQVPYFIKTGEASFEQNQFEAFTKLSETKDTSTGTKVLAANNNQQAINNLVLVLKNSLADRSVNISGSNDAQHWYSIKEYVNLQIGKAIDPGYFIQSISFPLVQYKYFQIAFNGRQHDPMFIEKVGTYKSVSGLQNYFNVPSPKIIQHDSSNQYSYVQLISAENYRISKLQLFAGGTTFYQRTILFGTGYYNSDKEPNTAILSSASDNVYFMDFLKGIDQTDTINLRIQNNDNPVLHIDSVKMYQDAYAIYAWLKAGQKYQLMFGNDSINVPVYDLSAFAGTIKSAMLLSTGNIVANHFTPTAPAANSALSKIWLWAIIAVVLALLLLFTASLVKQIKKKHEAAS